MQTQNNLSEIKQSLMQIIMFQMGILPMMHAGIDMRRALKQLDDATSRKFRRKFRKIWRTTLKQYTLKCQFNEKTIWNKKLGIGKSVPSRAERNARKQLVISQLLQTVVSPLMNRFENPENKNKNANVF